MSKLLGGLKGKLGISKVLNTIENAVEKDLNTYVKRRYEEITEPFETDFTFEVVKEDGNDGAKFIVRPIEVMIPRSDNPDRGSVSSWVLFNALDLGSTGTAKVYLPDNFANETSPNSLKTSSQQYDRNAIFVDGTKKGKDMEPRNWSRLIVEEYDARRFVKPRAVVASTVKKVFGIK